MTVHGDPDRLMQVMSNLLSNAVKFSPPQGRIAISLIRQGRRFRITVHDEGEGIPDDFRGRIFQKFSQAEPSDGRRKGSTGLGLYIAKAIVEHHGGSIGFESARGRGTTFMVDLPEAVPERTAPAGAIA